MSLSPTSFASELICPTPKAPKITANIAVKKWRKSNVPSSTKIAPTWNRRANTQKVMAWAYPTVAPEINPRLLLAARDV